MKPIFRLCWLACLIATMGCRQAPPEPHLEVGNLRCETLENPIGIDITAPRLSWVLSSDRRSTMQTAYRVMAASSIALLEQDSADLWDSGKVNGERSYGIRYRGEALPSQLNVFWKVKVWSGRASSSWSEIGSWKMGLLDQNDWEGRWIGFDRSFSWDREVAHSRLSARYFRKEFQIPAGKEISAAYVYIVGLGLYELMINGQKIGTDVLAPSPTDYTKNVKYNTWDVSEMLSTGSNAIAVVLGNGRYYTMQQHYKAYKIKNFGYPKLLLNLVISYADGTTEIIVTDDSWKGTADGPIRSNNEYDGEYYDARKEFPGWSLSGFDDQQWLQAEYVQEPGGTYEAQLNESMVVMDSLVPVSCKLYRPGVHILDMGQNMVGWLKMRVQGKRGTTIRLRFAESLTEDGGLFTENLRDAKATDSYTLHGQGPEEWHPSFVYHGFRYVEITGYPGTPGCEDFLGMVVYDRLPRTGYISFSDSLLNSIVSNAYWSIIGNYKGMPVDCPQRDERQPWLGDRTMVSYGESFLFDNSRLYAKWLDDIRYAQRMDGSIPDVAPAFWRYYSDNMTWAGTYIMVANMLYQQFGDLRAIQTHYPYMKKWLSYMERRYLKNGIMTKDSYGDWCAPPASIEEGMGMSGNVKRPSALISSAYYYHFLEVMQEFAMLCQQEDDALRFKQAAARVVEAFNKEFLQRDPVFYGENSLTENLLALTFGLVPKELEENLEARLIEILASNENHLSSGIVGVQWLMRSLSRRGFEDLAFQIATNRTYPSWGYMVENGATTFWELWNGNTAAPDMNSQNHVMLMGDLMIWCFEDLAGIRSHPDHPAFKKVLMKPVFPVGLKHLESSFRSLHGPIVSNWSVEEDSLYWDISLPANTTAEVHFPVSNANLLTESGYALNKVGGVNSFRSLGSSLSVEIGSGSYRFIAPFSPDSN